LGYGGFGAGACGWGCGGGEIDCEVVRRWGIGVLVGVVGWSWGYGIMGVGVGKWGLNV